MQLSSLLVLAGAAFNFAAAWPFVLYSDVNCTSVVAAYSSLPAETCISTAGVQSYSGSLDADEDQVIAFYKDKSGCAHDAYPAAVLEGTPQACVFVYKHIQAFLAAKVTPVGREPVKITPQL